MLDHGGRLTQAASEFAIPVSAWLDLSTGIAPFGWPVEQVPAKAWHRLPEGEDGLAEIARHYYGAPCVLPVPGTQAAIQALPYIRSRSNVGVVQPGYAEHSRAWQRAGHAVTRMPAAHLVNAANAFDVIVLIHPNNPTGERFSLQQLLELHAQLAAHGGWLVVDEAFMDATPDGSLCAYTDRPGLVVMRSAGKFFGLAGARAGCVCAEPPLLEALREQIGPWALAGPSRYVFGKALADHPWQMHQRERLRVAGSRLTALLCARGLPPTGGTALFQWCLSDHASAIHYGLARCGILVRRFTDPEALRFGLPRDESAFRRLDACLREVMA